MPVLCHHPKGGQQGHGHVENKKSSVKFVKNYNNNHKNVEKAEKHKKANVNVVKNDNNNRKVVKVMKDNKANVNVVKDDNNDNNTMEDGQVDYDVVVKTPRSSECTTSQHLPMNRLPSHQTTQMLPSCPRTRLSSHQFTQVLSHQAANK